MKAVLRRVRISPSKVNLVAGMVRGKPVNESLNILKFTPKKGARILYKVLHSAAYNAKNNFNQSLEDLIVTKILVTKGPMYKRTMPVSRGRSHPILKRTAHVTVEVGVPEIKGKEMKKESHIKEEKIEKPEQISTESAKEAKKATKKRTAVKKEEVKKEAKEKKTKNSK